jgi:signal transduction histidine kinase
MKFIQKSLVWKLSLAFIFVALVSVALVVALIRFTSVDRFSNFIVEQQRSSYQADLQSYYQEHGSWADIQVYWANLRPEPSPNLPQGNNDHPPYYGAPPERDRRSIFGLADDQGKVIVAVDPDYTLGMVIPANMLKGQTAIEVNGKRVGTLISGNFQPRLNPIEMQFLDRTNQILLVAAVSATLLAAAMGLFMARTLIRPINVLTTAAENMARGSLEQKVHVNSQDELAQLATAFNTMSAKVAQAHQLRRQMTADIAHDLRTPLTVIAGYIESMRDGILAPTPERLNLIYSEIDRLQDLVGDLRLLSRVDAGELPLHTQLLAPRYLLEKAAAPFQPGAEQHKVALRVEASDELPLVNVDEGRMMQVFSNLLSNALRYTPEGGEITLSAQNGADGVDITVRDNGTGIDAEILPRLFDRFFRVDDSRHNDHGESGLGLAIAKALVEAHGGSIRAESVPGQGTSMHIWLSIRGPSPTPVL